MSSVLTTVDTTFLPPFTNQFSVGSFSAITDLSESDEEINYPLVPSAAVVPPSVQPTASAVVVPAKGLAEMPDEVLLTIFSHLACPAIEDVSVVKTFQVQGKKEVVLRNRKSRVTKRVMSSLHDQINTQRISKRFRQVSKASKFDNYTYKMEFEPKDGSSKATYVPLIQIEETTYVCKSWPLPDAEVPLIRRLHMKPGQMGGIIKAIIPSTLPDPQSSSSMLQQLSQTQENMMAQYARFGDLAGVRRLQVVCDTIRDYLGGVDTDWLDPTPDVTTVALQHRAGQIGIVHGEQTWKEMIAHIMPNLNPRRLALHREGLRVDWLQDRRRRRPAEVELSYNDFGIEQWGYRLYQADTGQEITVPVADIGSYLHKNDTKQLQLVREMIKR